MPDWNENLEEVDPSARQVLSPREGAERAAVRRALVRED